MKNFFTFLFLSALAGNLFGQDKTGLVKGRVADSASKGMEAVSVQVLKMPAATKIKTVVSDKEGQFEINQLPAGKYVLNLTAVGFEAVKTAQFELSAARMTIELPVISMKPAGNELSNVTVTAHKQLIEQKVDRTVVNVDASPSNTGSTALEVLEKSPGISVNSDGVISLKGKQGVIVLVDGKPTYLSSADLAVMLKNMPAAMLDQIEIMTNPPAKYDAAGNSGIINIKTKKNKNNGFNGSITAGASLGLYERQGDYLFPFKQNSSVNFNYRKNKFNVFGNASYNYREGKNDLEINRNFFNRDGSLNSYSRSVTQTNMRNNNYGVKLGMDYYADSKNIFGVVFNGFGFFGHPRPNSAQGIYLADGTLESVLNTQTQNELTFYNYSGNFNYKHVFDTTGTELTADFDYIGYSNRTQTGLVTSIYDGGGNPVPGGLILRGDIPSYINIYSAKSDFTHPMKKNMRFDAGFKLSYVKSDNEVLYDRQMNDSTNKPVWIPDARSNHFIYEENIYAAYVSVNKKWKKWSTQAGLRLENTVSHGRQVLSDSTFTRHYTSLFPTVYLNYDLNKNNILTFAYGRRIERPNYQDLNPFIWFLDSLTYRQGNPYLLPQYSNNFELKHTYKSGLQTTLNYTITDNVIAQILKQNTDQKITYLTTDNVARFRNIGISVNVPFKPAKWWSGNGYVNVYNNKYSGTYFNSLSQLNEPLDVSYTSFTMNLTNTFTFSHGWLAEITGFYRGKGVDQLSISEPMYFMSWAGQKTLLKGKGTLKLSVRDPFHWQVYKAQTVYGDIDMKIYSRWDNRSATLTFTYRFGKSGVPQARRRSSATNEEQNRAGGQQQ